MAYSPFISPTNRPTDLTPNAFSGTGGNYTSQEVVSDFDIYKPNELIQVFERHSYNPGFRMMLKGFGFRRGTSAPTTGHYEYPWRDNLVTVGAIDSASAGAGNTMDISLPAGEMFDPTITGGGGNKASYARVGEMLWLPSGKKAMITVKDTSASPHVLTIKPIDATVDLDNEVTASESYFISDNAWGEATGLPEGRTPRVIKYTNDFQIVKEACGTTGSELTNETYFEPVAGKSGSFYLKTSLDTLYRFENACSGALLFGDTIDNITIATGTGTTDGTTVLGHDVALKGTEGLIAFAETNAYKDLYTAGSYALADFDNLGGYFEDERVGTRHMVMWQGRDIYIEIENVLVDFYDGADSNFMTKDMLGFDGASPNDNMQLTTSHDFSTAIGFKAIKKGGYFFCFKQLHEFNNSQGAGSSDYNFKKWSVIMPLGYTADKNSGTMTPTVGYEYKELNGYSRENVVADISGIGVAGTGTPYARAQHEIDIHRTGFVSETCFHACCANHVVIQRPT